MPLSSCSSSSMWRSGWRSCRWWPCAGCCRRGPRIGLAPGPRDPKLVAFSPTDATHARCAGGPRSGLADVARWLSGAAAPPRDHARGGRPASGARGSFHLRSVARGVGGGAVGAHTPPHLCSRAPNRSPVARAARRRAPGSARWRGASGCCALRRAVWIAASSLPTTPASSSSARCPRRLAPVEARRRRRAPHVTIHVSCGVLSVLQALPQRARSTASPQFVPVLAS